MSGSKAAQVLGHRSWFDGHREPPMQVTEVWRGRCGVCTAVLYPGGGCLHRRAPTSHSTRAPPKRVLLICGRVWHLDDVAMAS